MNWDHTKYIPMTQKQLDNGRMMSDNEILYKPTSTTILSSEDTCEWQILIQGSKVFEACQFVPIPKQNMLITIAENDLLFGSFLKNTTLFETCNNTLYTQRNVQGRIIFKLDPNFSFKTERFMIKPHKTTSWNATEIMLPTVEFNKHLIIKLNEETIERLNWTNGSWKELNVIENTDQISQIIEMARNSVEKANQEAKLQNIHYDANTISFASGIMGSISIFGIIITVISMAIYKCNLFGCIIRVVLKRGTNAHVELDGVLTLDMPQNLIPKLKGKGNGQQATNVKSAKQQLNGGTIETKISF